MNKFIGITIGALVIIGGYLLLNAPRPHAPAANPAATSTPATSSAPAATPSAAAPAPVPALTPPAGERAPAFSLKDYAGTTVSLADFAGKPLVINSWASWCPFCRAELPDLAAVQKEVGGAVAFLAIDRAESRDQAKRYSDALGLSSGLIFLLDPTDSFYQSIGGFSMPETIFVDKAGIIRDHKRGPMAASEIRRRLKMILPATP